MKQHTTFFPVIPPVTCIVRLAAPGIACMVLASCSPPPPQQPPAADSAPESTADLEGEWSIHQWREDSHQHKTGAGDHFVRDRTKLAIKPQGSGQYIIDKRASDELRPQDPWESAPLVRQGEAECKARVNTEICWQAKLVTAYDGTDANVPQGTKQDHYLVLGWLGGELDASCERKLEESRRQDPSFNLNCLEVELYCLDDDCTHQEGRTMSLASEGLDPVHKGSGHAHSRT